MKLCRNGQSIPPEKKEKKKKKKKKEKKLSWSLL